VKTGVQGTYNWWKELDSGFRRNDGKHHFLTFYEFIIFRVSYNLQPMTYDLFCFCCINNNPFEDGCGLFDTNCGAFSGFEKLIL